jgi:hypothetical protein
MRAVVTALLLATCVPANAQNSNCAPHAMFIEGLADRYGERRVMAGLNGDGTVVEIFANDQTGTWTALIVQPTGIACMVASGEQFDSTVADLPPSL